MKIVTRLRAMGIHALQRMYRPSEGMFAFRLRREDDRDVLEGVSGRYTAIVLIALARECVENAQTVLGAHSLDEVCARLIEQSGETGDLGQVALTVWAARALGHADAKRALERLRAMRPDTDNHSTVEIAWALSALAVRESGPTDGVLAARVADRLMRSFQSGSELFPHWPEGASPSGMRGHVTCFADLVYPIQALSLFHRATDSSEARKTAERCAQRMCDLQGPEGQWWWHYDVRTGQVLEKYPVYSIHQDAMAPMALFDLNECCGIDHFTSIERSMSWLLDPPEIPGSLVDGDAGVIWRKVARHEPGKVVRSLQAGLSRIHPRLRMPGVDLLFPARYIDFEARPYEMGWMLYAWSPQRLASLWSR